MILPERGERGDSPVRQPGRVAGARTALSVMQIHRPVVGSRARSRKGSAKLREGGKVTGQRKREQPAYSGSATEQRDRDPHENDPFRRSASTASSPWRGEPGSLHPEVRSCDRADQKSLPTYARGCRGFCNSERLDHLGRGADHPLRGVRREGWTDRSRAREGRPFGSSNPSPGATYRGGRGEGERVGGDGGKGTHPLGFNPYRSRPPNLREFSFGKIWRASQPPTMNRRPKATSTKNASRSPS